MSNHENIKHKELYDDVNIVFNRNLCLFGINDRQQYKTIKLTLSLTDLKNIVSDMEELERLEDEQKD